MPIVVLIGAPALLLILPPAGLAMEFLRLRQRYLEPKALDAR